MQRSIRGQLIAASETLSVLFKDYQLRYTIDIGGKIKQTNKLEKERKKNHYIRVSILGFWEVEKLEWLCTIWYKHILKQFENCSSNCTPYNEALISMNHITWCPSWSRIERVWIRYSVLLCAGWVLLLDSRLVLQFCMLPLQPHPKV